MHQLKTLLVDDNEAFLVLAGHLLQGNPRIKVVGRGFNGYDAVRLAESLKPELILMDLSMPGMGGLQATRLIKAQDDPPLILITSHHDDAEHREHSARAGADGFLSKQDFDKTLDGVLDSLSQFIRQEV
ncbi:DNA-binding response regulator [Stagnimonas aquatica]|uniref:DNA-binding response regulator n=1 Tax=Stagnimonas aquatica TaxID=2689987 RepID=A0A3N0V590_9GAMM|nr:response regulator transcription factor [Stagnimonas aquatica]ROH87754.1 DNA-binding response regulator [Stagnimonas aquatica]